MTRLDHPDVERRTWRDAVAESVVACALVACVGLVPLLWQPSASADADETAAVMLARTCVSERGWAVESDDCAAIAEVVRLRMRRTGESWIQALGELSPRLHGDAPIGRPWLRGLVDEDPPRGWREARWDRYRDAWLATLAEARELVESERAVCEEPPTSWGSADDVRRRAARGARWVEVDCGSTRNRFGRWVR